MEKLARAILAEDKVLAQRCRVVLMAIGKASEGYTFYFAGTKIELVLVSIGAIRKENGKYYANAGITL